MRGGMTAGALLAALVLPGTCLGQWSPDSLQNLAVCDAAGEQVTPKIAPTSDGGCYVSWFDSRGGGYAVYLQRLDAGGNPLLTPGGLLVSDHPQQSWLVDYDLDVDGANNAVLVFSDTRYADGELDVTAYRIGGDGTFLWGADGICLSDTTQASFEPAPKGAVAGNGDCVFTWGRSGDDDDIVFQRISPDGDKLWGTWGIAFGSSEAALSSPDVVASGDEDVILMWKRTTGSYPSQTTWLYTGLLDASGDWGWGDTPVLIYDSGDISPWAFPEISPDGQGGAVYSWYDAPSISVFNVWVQRMDADGDMLFPMNGAQASTNSSDRLHMDPSAACDPLGQETVVFWVESNANQNQFGLYGQRFSSTGGRLWTDAGLEIVPLGPQQTSFATTLADDDGAYVAYFVGDALRAVRLGFDGGVVWGPVTLSAGSLGGKDDLVACPGVGQSALYAWCDNRNDYGIYAQNLNLDGSLGPGTGIGGGAPLLPAELSVAPNPSTAGMTVRFTLETGAVVSVELWDLSGRLVRRLSAGPLAAGGHEVFLDGMGDDGSRPGPGVYLVRLVTEDGVAVSPAVRL